jgi:hypothetical protein
VRRAAGCVWDAASAEPIAPTLAKYTDPDQHIAQAQADLAAWAAQNLPRQAMAAPQDVDLLRIVDTPSDVVATLLYPVTNHSYRALYTMALAWSAERRAEVVDVATRSRTRRDELLRNFRGGPYVYDIVMDIGAYRDLHRHRRCQQFRQAYTGELGFATPALVEQAGLAGEYTAILAAAAAVRKQLPAPGAHYLLPFAARGRFLFKMDFAEAEYIARLRSGVKGHFSYRQVAWEMKLRMEDVEPELARLMHATPPWEEDPLNR